MPSEQDQGVLRRVHFHRNRRKLFQNVIGYLQGIIASGRITAAELAALHMTIRDAADANCDPDLIDLGYATRRLVDQAEVGDADEADLRDLIDCVLEYRTPDEVSETSALEELLGLCSGIVADGIVTDEEAVALRNWLGQHPFAEIEWPVTDLVARLERIFADGRIDESERSELRDALSNLVGGNFVETGSSSLRLAAELAEHVAHEMALADRTLCLTGEFFFGSRRQCVDASEACGSRVARSVSGRVDYLVLGAVGSQHWVTTSFGRKIEKAMNMRAEHGRPMLVLEDVWRAAVAAQS